MSFGTEVTLGKHPRVGLVAESTNHVIRGLGHSAPPPPASFRDGRGARDRFQSPITNDLISCRMKPPYSPRRWVLESFWVDEHIEVLGE